MAALDLTHTFFDVSSAPAPATPDRKPAVANGASSRTAAAAGAVAGGGGSAGSGAGAGACTAPAGTLAPGRRVEVPGGFLDYSVSLDGQPSLKFQLAVPGQAPVCFTMTGHGFKTRMSTMKRKRADKVQGAKVGRVDTRMKGTDADPALRFSSDVCGVCLTNEPPFIGCNGQCLRVFHPRCVQFASFDDTPDDYKCRDCVKGQHRCKLCHELAPVNPESGIVKCSKYNCGAFYHPLCLAKAHAKTVRTHKVGATGAVNKFLCPSHWCSTCGESKAGTSVRKCVACPRAFHRTKGCTPRSCEVLSDKRVVCDRHQVSQLVARLQQDFATRGDRQQIVGPSADDDDEAILCHVCDMPDASEDNVMVICERCEVATHQLCYGIDEIPDDDWFCASCMSIPRAAKPPICVLCPFRGGAMKKCTTSAWAHVACAVWLPDTAFEDTVRYEGICGVDSKDNAIPINSVTRRGFHKTKCPVCDTQRGAGVKCVVPGCNVEMHVLCARYSGCDMYIDYSSADVPEFYVACADHSYVFATEEEGTRKRTKACPIAEGRPVVNGCPPFINPRTTFMYRLVEHLATMDMHHDLPLMYQDLPVDLYQLYLHVHSHGGYDKTRRDTALWDEVVHSMPLFEGQRGSWVLNNIYVNYLRRFEDHLKATGGLPRHDDDDDDVDMAAAAASASRGSGSGSTPPDVPSAPKRARVESSDGGSSGSEGGVDPALAHIAAKAALRVSSAAGGDRKHAGKGSASGAGAGAGAGAGSRSGGGRGAGRAWGAHVPTGATGANDDSASEGDPMEAPDVDAVAGFLVEAYPSDPYVTLDARRKVAGR